MTFMQARSKRKIGFVRTLRGAAELARQRERLRSFGCERVFESDANLGFSALHSALASLQAGDQFVVCTVAEMGWPSFLLLDLVARHGATVVSLES